MEKLLSETKDSKTLASLERVSQKLTGRKITLMEKKTAVNRVIKAFVELEAGYATEPQQALQRGGRPTMIQPRAPRGPTEVQPSNLNKPFAKPGEEVTLLYKNAPERKVKWNEKLEQALKEAS